jgi:hypothetical protein
MMHLQRSRFVCAIAVAFVVVTAARPAGAQTVTTGTVSGTVVDPQGAVLPGATVSAVHEPTGTRYEAVTGANGRFEVPNVRVGGPYTVTAALSGFRDQTERDVNVALGENRVVDVELQLQTGTETVTVIADVPLIDPTRAGTAANISKETIETLPTIQRSLFDFARTSPYVNLNPDSAGGDSFISIAGRNNRYNNIQIDGAQNNDLFGIPATGTPGGQVASQPISLDAIQEIQLVVAPYDVRQGGFSGGGINAITRSGSNSFNGTGYMFGRNNQSWSIGKIPGVATAANPSPADTKVGSFSDKQGGFSVGGPIKSSKAFFFGNLDLQRRLTPSGLSADGSSGQPFGGLTGAGVPVHLAEVQEIADLLKNQYGFNPGGLAEFSRPARNDKVFVRTDFNVSSKHQLTLRTNYVRGSNVPIPSSATSDNRTFVLPDGYAYLQEKISSTVGQLNSTWSSKFNEFRITYQRDLFRRGDQPDFAHFPYVRVDLSDGSTVRAGTEFSSQANQLNQNIVEVTDDVTWVKGQHTVTIGTHNEFFHFYNVFIQNIFGQYEFASLANFRTGIAGSYFHNFSNTADPLQPAEFSVAQWGGYVGDQWRARSNLTLTYGLRLDAPHFPDVPRRNPIAETDFKLRTDVVPAPKMWSPRVGFNWDLSNGGGNRSQVRGGLGFFTGRTPYVWLSNQYSNTGLDFTSLSVNFNANNSVRFVADPNAQPTTVTGGATGRQSLNLIDPDYKFPEIVRGNLAFDRALGFGGLIGTAEFLFTKNVKEIAYSNINYIVNGTLPDGRFTYTKFDSALNDVLLLSNTTKGGQWTLTFKLERPFRNGFYFGGSYLYNQAKSINDGTASTAGSNWANNPVQYDANNPPLTTSVFQVGSRVNLTAAVPIPLGKGFRSTASFFYNGQTGRPYVIMFIGDANGDGRSNNDIAFVPASPDQVAVINGTWDQLNAFLSADSASKNNRGTIPVRNAGLAPWTNSLDARYAVSLPTGGRTKVELTMDVFNILNLLNKNWGWAYFPLFPASGGGLIGYNGLTSGKETLNLNTIASPNFLGTFTRDDLRSRWQAQWGVRVRF